MNAFEDGIAAQALTSPAAPQRGRDKTRQSDHDSDAAHSKRHSTSVGQVGFQSSEDKIITAARELMGMVKSRVPAEKGYDGETITAASVIVEIAKGVPTENTNNNNIITAARELVEMVNSRVSIENKHDGGAVAPARVMPELASDDLSQERDDNDHNDDDDSDDR